MESVRRPQHEIKASNKDVGQPYIGRLKIEVISGGRAPCIKISKAAAGVVSLQMSSADQSETGRMRLRRLQTH